jgi:hypothetical protein
MRKQLAVLAILMGVGTAAGPGPKPVITLDGVSAAARLSPELRAAIAPQVKALNATLEKMVALKASSKANPQQRAHGHEAMKGSHDDHKQLHEEIIKLLDPEQQAAFFKYLHEQMKAAGIDVPHPPHDGRAHPPHEGSSD